MPKIPPQKMVTLENYKSMFAYFISGTFVTVFRDFFDRFTLNSSIFDKIAEGPHSFCHHCKLKQTYTVEKCKSVSRVKRDLIQKIKN